MAVIVGMADQIKPLVGKAVARVSMSAYDIGLHDSVGAVFLIERPWSLQDRDGQERDRNFGARIRPSTGIFLLAGQTLRAAEKGDGFFRLVFDRHVVRVSVPVSAYRTMNMGLGGEIGGAARSVRWDPLPLMGPGYLLGRDKKTKAPAYQVRGAGKDPKDLTSLYGQLVSRVTWSAIDIGLYFQGQQTLAIECIWVLADGAGVEQDRAVPLKDRQGSALFRLIGLSLVSVEQSADGMRFRFEEGWLLTALYQ